jgi:hypothetical protein
VDLNGAVPYTRFSLFEVGILYSMWSEVPRAHYTIGISQWYSAVSTPEKYQKNSKWSKTLQIVVKSYFLVKYR